MKQTLLALFLVAAFFTLPLVSTAGSADQEPQVLNAENALCHAYATGDVAYIKTHVAEDYTLTDGAGEITTRQDDIDDLTSGKAHYTTFENSDMKVRFYGATAIVTGRTLVKGTYDGQALDVEVQFTDTMVRINSQWCLVAGHVSRIRP
jgi:ketosteroid isomerase-like protein